MEELPWPVCLDGARRTRILRVGINFSERTGGCGKRIDVKPTRFAACTSGSMRLSVPRSVSRRRSPKVSRNGIRKRRAASLVTRVRERIGRCLNASTR